jgi:hypothetical protein
LECGNFLGAKEKWAGNRAASALPWNFLLRLMFTSFSLLLDVDRERGISKTPPGNFTVTLGVSNYGAGVTL